MNPLFAPSRHRNETAGDPMSAHGDAFTIIFPDRKRAAIEDTFGREASRAWMSRLPRIVAERANEWGLHLAGMPDSGSLSCCVFANTACGAPVVLKVPFDVNAGARERDAMREWSGSGIAPAILAADDITGAFLMDRVIPGDSVESARGIRHMRSIVHLMSIMHAKRTYSAVPTIADVMAMRFGWAEKQLGSTGGAGAELVERARNLAARAVNQLEMRTVVHGDFQSKNILRSESFGLHVIDPMPALGDPVIDASLWAVTQHYSATIAACMQHLATCGWFLEAQLSEWCTIFAVLELRPGISPQNQRIGKFISSAHASDHLALRPIRRALVKSIRVSSRRAQ